LSGPPQLTAADREGEIRRWNSPGVLSTQVKRGEEGKRERQSDRYENRHRGIVNRRGGDGGLFARIVPAWGIWFDLLRFL
jgi:hypothetical protein